MADQQRKVSLIFEANTSQAKNEINSLIASLQKVQSMPASLIDPTGIKEASKAALELQGHIQKAVNVDTGKLDLSRFAASLSSSGKDLNHFRDTLVRIGPEGTAAFRSVLNSINNAEVSTVRLTKGMRDFLTTMKNTAKWQISSSIMHGLIGGLQSAWGYAQSLDRSLNNIRIVTGQTTDQMARFAIEANKAAQALSTTTTKYTDAALIFYQQGLSDQAVKERTEAVIKMANVTGEVAKDVSSYMTAIWNNFDNGSKSLEYYADVITKLGAATAASSEEIAGGLEKFAAVANTIGLSYEYATSMLTTIIDKTRQSEDVVGTALKTILARIQGLNLGETLEDGTTLNKYSEALAIVGVNIKDASGQLRDMDSVLDDLGSKWNTFSKDTQIALAQVVGGVRQYNQIISLMDNWSAFKQNVSIAETSAGSLDEQAEIYAESWEAARNRVTAAAQGIYDALINEDVFIKLDDIFTHLLQGVSGVVKGMGGMIPIIGTIGGFVTQKFAKEMPVALNRITQNFAILSGKAQKDGVGLQKQITAEADLGVARSVTSQEAAQYETIKRVSQMREQLLNNMHRLNSEEIKNYQMQIQNEETIGHIVEERAKALDLITQETQQLKEQVALKTAQTELEKEESSIWNDKATKEDLPSSEWKDSLRQSEEEFQKQLEKDKKNILDLKIKEENNELDVFTAKEYARAQKRIELSKNRGSQEYVDEIYRGAQAIHQKKVKDQSDNIITASSSLKQAQIASADFKLFLTQDFDSPAQKLEALNEKIKGLKNSLDVSGGSSDELNNLIQELGNDADISEDKIKALDAAIENVIANRKNNLNDTVTEAKNLGISDADIINLKKQGEIVGTNEGPVLDRGEIPSLDIPEPSKIQVATEAMGALMSAYGAVNAVMEAWNTLADENATAMEKLGAVMGALVSITMTANSVIQLTTTLKELETVKTMMSAAADAVKTASVTGLSKAYVGLSAAMKQVPGVGWALAAISVITALGVAIASIDWRTDKQKEIDELTDKVKALDTAQQNLSQHISEVESAWDNYQNAVKALEACTTGTEAWNDALLKCNESVLALMALSPELAQFVQYNADGSISLGGVGYEDYIAEQKRANMALTAQNTIAKAELKKLELSDSIYGSEDLNANISKYTTSKEGRVAIAAAQESAANFTEFIIEFSKNFESVEQASQYLVDTGILSGAYKSVVESLIRSGDTQYMSQAYDASQALWSEQELNIEDINATWAENITLYEGYVKNQEAANHTLLATLEGYEQENLGLYGEKLSQAIDDKEKEILAENKTTKELRQAMKDAYGGEIENYEELENAEMAYALAVHSVTSNLELLNSTVSIVNSSLFNLSNVGKSLARTGSLAGVALKDLNLINKASVSQEKYDNFNIQETGKTLKVLEYNTSKNLNTEYQEQLAVKRNEELRKINLSNLSNRIKAAKSYEETVAAYNKEADAAAQGLELINSIYSAAENEKYAFSQEEQEELFRYDIMRAQLANASEEKNWYQSLFGLDSEKESLESSIKSIEEKFEGIADIQNRPILSEEAAYAAQALGIISNWNPEDKSEALYKQLNDILSNIEYTKDMTATSENISEIEVILDALANESVTKAPPEGYVQSSELQKQYNTLKKQGVYGESVIEEDFDSSEELKNWLDATFSEEDAAEILKENPADISNYIPKEEYANWVDNLYKTLGKDKFSEVLNSLGTSLEEFNKGTEKEQYTTLNKNIFEINRALNSGKEALAAEILGVEDTAKLFETVLTEEQRTGTYAEQWNLIEEQVKTTNPEEWYRQELLSATGADEKKYGEENAREFARDMKLITEEQFENAEFIIDWAKISELFNQAIIDNMEAGISAWNKIESSRFKTTYEVINGQYVSKGGEEAKTPVDYLFDAFISNGALIKDIDTFATSFNAIASGLDEKSFEELSSALQALMNDGADATTTIEIFNQLLETLQNSGKITAEDMAKVLTDNNLAGTEFEQTLISLANILSKSASAASTAVNNFEKLTDTINGLKSLLNIASGDEISEKEYDTFKDILTEEQKAMFMRSAGGYTYFGTEKDAITLEQTARKAAFQNYYNNRQDKQLAGEAADIANAVWFNNGKSLEENLSSTNILSFLSGSQSGLKNINTQKLFELAGIQVGSIEAVQKAIDSQQIVGGKYLGEDEETKNAIMAMTDTIIAYLRGDFAYKTDEEAQLQLTSINSRDELQTALASGDIKIGTGKGQISEIQFDSFESNLIGQEYERNFNISIEDIQQRVEYMKKYEDITGKTTSEITELAAAELRFERGLKNGTNNIKDWTKVLKKADKEAVDWENTLINIEQVYSDLFNIKADSLSKEFIQSAKNAELLEKALDGNQEAFNELKISAADDLFDGEELASQLDYKELSEGKRILLRLGVDEISWDETLNTVQSYIDEMNNNALISPEIQMDNINTALEDLKFRSAEAALDASESLSAMGVDAEIVEHVVHKDGSHYTKTATGTWLKFGPNGEVSEEPVSAEVVMNEGEEVQRYFTIQGKNFNGGVSRRVSKPSSSGKGGGGGSKKPTAQKKKISDIERYHTVTNQLEDLADSYEAVANAADKAFGKSRLMYLKAEGDLIEEQIALNQRYIAEAERHLSTDLNNLNQTSSMLGMEIQFDENGTILNWEELQKAAMDLYNSHLNDKGEVIDMDEEAWKEWEENYEEVMGYLDKYEETQDILRQKAYELLELEMSLFDKRLEEALHSVNLELEDLERNLDHISDATDRAYGADKIEGIKNTTKAIKEEIAALEEERTAILNFAQKELIDGKQLEELANLTGKSVQYDSTTWVIANAEELQTIVDQMLVGASAERTAEILKAANALSMSEDIAKRLKENEDKQIDKQYQYEDSRLEEITYTVDVKIETSEDVLEYLDFMLQKIGDDAWDAAEKIAVLGDKTANLLQQNEFYKQGIVDILSQYLSNEDIQAFLAGDTSKVANLNLREDEVNAIREYSSGLMDTSAALLELRETVHAEVLDAFNQFNDEMDESISKLDHLAAMTQHYQNIVDIVGKKNLDISNALLESVGQASVDQAINRVTASRTKVEMIEEEVAAAQKVRDEAQSKGLEEEVKLWDKNLKEMNASLADAQEDFMQSWEDALTQIGEQFELAVNNAVETLSDSLAGPLYNSMSELQEAFDRQKNVSDRYLEDYEKIYQLSKLNRDILESIDDTDNIKAKQELAALQAEVNALEAEGVQISEYEMENMRRRYELKLAELALSEAQNAKSEVRMSRTADGSWSYVYTASEEDVAEAEQNYEDKLYAIQEANYQYIEELENNIVQLQDEMTQRIQEIMLDESLSMEERMAKVQEVTEYYKEQMDYYSEQMNIVLDNNSELYTNDWTKYSEMTGYKISADEEYIDKFSETQLSVLTGFNNMEEYQQNFNNAIGDPNTPGTLLYDLTEAYKDWQTNVDTAMTEAGTSVKDFADTMSTEVKNIVDDSDIVVDEIKDLRDEAVDRFNEITTAVSNWATNYSSEIDSVIADTQRMVKEWQAAQAIMSGVTTDTTGGETGGENNNGEDGNKPGTTVEPNPQAPGNTGGNDGGGGQPGDIGKLDPNDPNVKLGVAWAIITGRGGWGNGNNPYDLTSGKRFDTLTEAGFTPQEIQNMVNAYDNKSGDWFQKHLGSDKTASYYSFDKFDTGGYTGAWGPEGRMAMLHQKELVLNQADTKNLLAAVNIIRDIASIIDLNAYTSAGYGMATKSMATIRDNGQILQQQVSITAEFPNATDKNEIIDAFSEVINLASQYANKK